jgi:hypothetical protein
MPVFQTVLPSTRWVYATWDNLYRGLSPMSRRDPGSKYGTIARDILRIGGTFHGRRGMSRNPARCAAQELARDSSDVAQSNLPYHFIVNLDYFCCT